MRNSPWRTGSTHQASMQAVKFGCMTKWSYSDLSCTISPVDRMHPHTDTVHEPRSCGSNAAKAEDSADTAREHAVPRELIKLATFEVFVLQDQPLGGGKCHGESVLGHRLGKTAAVGCHGHTFRKLAQRNEVNATD